MKRPLLFLYTLLLTLFTVQSQVWIVGENGTILRSMDGGTTFSALSAPNYDFKAVLSEDDDTTWFGASTDRTRYLVTADKGETYFDTIFRDTPEMDKYPGTIDGEMVQFPGTQVIMSITDAGGGKNLMVNQPLWDAKEYANGSKIQGIEAVNETTGYMVTGLRIWKTTNTGNNWTNVLDADIYNDVAEFDNGNLLIVGDNGFATLSTDGGSTWNDVTGMATTNHIEKIALSATSGKAVAIANDELWQTTDYGANWTLLNTFSKTLHCVAYINQDTLMVGGPDEGFENPFIQRSDDDGSTWTDITNVTLGDDWIAQGNTKPHTWDIHFFQKDTGWLTFTSGYNLRNPHVLRSLDGGITWDTTLFLDNGNDSHEPLVWAMNGQTALFFSGKNIYKTTDGGQTWPEMTLATTPAQDIAAVFFKDASNGYFIAGNEFYETTDGGQNWNKVTDIDASGDNPDFYGMTSSWVAGNKAKVFNTSDGGSTWDFVNLKPYLVGAYNDISASDENHIFVVGDNGYILYSNDAGANWNFAGDNGTFTDNLIQVESFTDTAYAISADGKTFLTTDGGSNWSFGQIDNGITLNDMDMPLPDMAMAVGNDGAAYHTTDWSTWTQITTNTIEQLNMVDYSDTTVYETVDRELNLLGISAQVYPNPSNGVVKVASQQPVTLNITIHNSTGAIIYKGIMKGTKKLINISNAASGIYQMTLQSGDIVTTKKLMILK